MTTHTIELLQQMIRNRCVNDGTPDSGFEHRSVETLIDYFGVAGEIVEPHPGRQNLIYRVPGSDPEAPTLTLLPHLDVVPVTEAELEQRPLRGRDHRRVRVGTRGRRHAQPDRGDGRGLQAVPSRRS